MESQKVCVRCEVKGGGKGLGREGVALIILVRGSVSVVGCREEGKVVMEGALAWVDRGGCG